MMPAHFSSRAPVAPVKFAYADGARVAGKPGKAVEMMAKGRDKPKKEKKKPKKGKGK